MGDSKGRISPPITAELALRESMVPFLRRYVPLAAALKLGAMSASDGASGVDLSEMRAVSVMFIALHGLRLAAETDGEAGIQRALARGQEAMLCVQSEIQSR